MSTALGPGPTIEPEDLVTLHRLGAHFLRCSPDKTPIGRWREAPHSIDRVVAHAARGGLVGLVPGSLGMFVVDVDAGGDAGAAAVRRVLGVDPLVTTKTRRDGGWHLWFRKPDVRAEIGNSTWRTPEGSGEIRADSGYVVLWDFDNLANAIEAERLGVTDMADPADVTKLAMPPGATGNGPPIVPDPPGPQAEEDLVRAFAALPNPGERGSAQDGSGISFAEAKEILAFIDPEPHDTWIRVGMAIRSSFPNQGFALWHKWSKGEFWKDGEPGSYDSEESCEVRWNSFHEDGPNAVTWRSVCAMARDEGADLASIKRRHRPSPSSPSGGSRTPNPPPPQLGIAPPDDLFHRFVLVVVGTRIYDTHTKLMLNKADVDNAWRHIHRGDEQTGQLLGNLLVTSEDTVRVDEPTWVPRVHDHEGGIDLVAKGPKMQVNTWEGFSVAPEPGDVKPWLDLMEHLIKEEDAREAVIDRFAFDIQHPDRKCNWHWVAVGVKGAGKGSAVAPLHAIFGQAAHMCTGYDEFASPYHDWLWKKKFVEIAELKGMPRDAMGKVRDLLVVSTKEQWKRLNIKSQPQIDQLNLWSFYMAANDFDVMPVEKDERRFMVTESPDKMDYDDVERYQQWMESGGPAHLMHWLLERDLEGPNFAYRDTPFDASIAPVKTAAFDKMVVDSVPPHVVEMREMLREETEDFSHGIADAKALHEVMKSRRIFCRLSDVRAGLEQIGWPKIVGINTAIKKDKETGKTMRQSQYWHAPESSELHTASGGGLYDQIQELRELRGLAGW